MSPNRRVKLKMALFERDGWRTEDGARVAVCAFGCGTLLTKSIATIDRYPIPGRLGGTYHIDNTRLACAPCNCNEGCPGNDVSSLQKGMSRKQRKAWRRALRTANKVQITPEGIFGVNSLMLYDSLNGIPIDRI